MLKHFAKKILAPAAAAANLLCLTAARATDVCTDGRLKTHTMPQKGDSNPINDTMRRVKWHNSRMDDARRRRKI